jgi:hypothetical protein
MVFPSRIVSFYKILLFGSSFKAREGVQELLSEA